MKWFNSKWRKAFGVWLGLVCLLFVLFGVLRFMSIDRVDKAEMIIQSKELIQKSENMEGDTELVRYGIALRFESPIFRAHRMFVEITPVGIESKQDSVPLSIDSFAPRPKDSKTLEMILPASFAQNHSLEVGQNIGTLSYTSYITYSGLINFFGRLVYVLVLGILVWFVRHPLRAYAQKIAQVYPRITPVSYITPLVMKDKVFLILSGIMIVGLFVFQFWLGFPGWHIAGDIYHSIGSAKNNAHPVFIAYVLDLLHVVFGYHLYYLFLFNLVPFYVGLLFLVWGFYFRFRSLFALLPLSIVFVGNIYFQNFIEYHSFALPMMLFCGYSMILFMLLAPLRNKKLVRILWWSIGLVFFFAILWRHNAIFSVFPASFVIVYMWLSDRGLSVREFVRHYAKGMLAAAFICLAIVICIPNILIQGRSYPANHLFLHQMAAMCVPTDDSSCFKDEWYYPHKGWEDIKTLYAKYPLNADPFNVSWGYDEERPIPYGKIEGLHSQWIKAIFKYPGNFLAHELRFIKAMWIQEPDRWIFDSAELQSKPTSLDHINIISKFPENERSITLTPTQQHIYDFLYEHRILLNHIWGVGLSFGVMMLSLFVWIWRRQWCNNLLVFSFSVGFAGFFSAFFIAIFTPVNEVRYMSLILPLGIVAFMGFVGFVVDVYQNKHK